MAKAKVRDDVELRCPNGHLQGILRTHQGIRCLEQKCHNWYCTKGKTVTTFHYYSLETGALVDTVVYQNHPNGRKQNGCSA